MTSPVLARSISAASSSGRPSTFTVPDTPTAPERFPCFMPVPPARLHDAPKATPPKLTSISHPSPKSASDLGQPLGKERLSSAFGIGSFPGDVAPLGPKAGGCGGATTIEAMTPSPEGLPGRVFRRSLDPDLPVALEAHGSTIIDATGRAYIDAAGGAIVVNVGHGRPSVAEVLAEQAGRLSYAHGSAFTTEPLEAYAREISVHLPVDGPAIYPVSGGSEAIETALKLARTYHLARGEADRWIVVSRG